MARLCEQLRHLPGPHRTGRRRRRRAPGPYAQYLLDVDMADLVPPKVTAVTGLPAAGTTTDDPVQSFSVT